MHQTRKSFVKSDQRQYLHPDVMLIYGSDFDEDRFQVRLETFQKYCTNLNGNACIRSVTDTLSNVKVQSYLSRSSCKKGSLKNFGYGFLMFSGGREACNLIKKETLPQVFSSEFLRSF